MSHSTNIPSPITPAQALHRLVALPTGATAPTDSQAHQAVMDFLDLLIGLEKKHASKVLSDDYLTGQVYARSRELKNDAEKGAYCRSHLKIALRQFRMVVDQIRGSAENRIAVAQLMPWKDIIKAYILDLIEIVQFLERKNAGYIYFNGGKNAEVHSWQVYLLSRGLAYQSVYRGTLPQFEDKTAQIAAIFVLRQSMELRFERLVGVYPEDKKGKRPRLKHGFHQDFIEANPQYFKCNGFSIGDLQSVYDWCSEVVHLAYQPYAWQTTWALELCGRLLGTREVAAGEHWNIANAVEILDVSDMQSAFETYFLENYDHGEWRMHRARPEALVRNWNSGMETTALEFRQSIAESSRDGQGHSRDRAPA